MNQPQASAPLSPAARAWEARGKYVAADGHRMFVADQGPGPPLVLLHGFPTTAYDWREVIDRLADTFRCVAPDFPGYGLSDKPVAYSYSLFQQADALEVALAELGIERAHVASHDMGTSVHCELLAREAQGRGRLAIASSTFLNGSMLQWLAAITPFQELLAANATLPTAIEMCQTLPQLYLPGLLAIMRRPERITTEMQEVLTELLRRQDGHLRLPALAGYMRERYIARDRWLGALGAARRPVQFVWADGDPIAHAEMGRQLHQMFPQHDYTELAGLGHFLLMEDPDRVAEAIGRWAAKYPLS